MRHMRVYMKVMRSTIAVVWVDGSSITCLSTALFFFFALIDYTTTVVRMIYFFAIPNAAYLPCSRVLLQAFQTPEAPSPEPPIDISKRTPPSSALRSLKENRCSFHIQLIHIRWQNVYGRESGVNVLQ